MRSFWNKGQVRRELGQGMLIGQLELRRGKRMLEWEENTGKRTLQQAELGWNPCFATYKLGGLGQVAFSL